jgi:hypothetical protein
MTRSLAACTFLFGLVLALPAQADDQSQANRLFVEATKLIAQGQATEDLGERADAYQRALERLELIVERYPGGDVAVKMAAGQQIGAISLPLARASAQLVRLREDLSTRRLPETEAKLRDTTTQNEELKGDNIKLSELLTEKENEIADLLREQAALRDELRAQAGAPSPQTGQSQQQALSRIAELEAQRSDLRRLLWDERARTKDLQAQVAGLQSRPDKPAASAASAMTAAAPQPAKSLSQSQVAALPAQTPPAAPSTAEITDGVREALKVGTERVVARLGRIDGFNADPKIHIPLPEGLREVRATLNMVGMSALADDVELKLNRAAETATPKAKALFWQAITDMSLKDIEGIYNGPDDAATQYLRASMSAPLRDEMRPVVDQSLAEVGAIQAYDGMIGRYEAIPFMPNVKADLTNHVLDKAMDGLFFYLGQEEAAIRNDALKRTTEILRRVFGAG